MSIINQAMDACRFRGHLDTLINQAMDACLFRGHDMGPWQENTQLSRAFSQCLICGAQVTVDVDPWPNGIDICGSAVATHCC